MKIHHVGYYVTDIDEARADFQKLGYEIASPCVLDKDRNVFIQFLYPENNLGALQIELIAAAEGCKLFGRLKKIGSTPYHICYECSNLEQAISDLKDDNFVLVREPQTAIAIDNRRVAFMYSGAVGLIELLEGKGEI